MSSGGLQTQGKIKQTQKNMPLITVITVVRNGENHLEKTILSVINQTYKNIEYILIDGASTDSTLDIIRKHESKIDYWISEPDEGIYDAMNKGIALAAGEWINFMNAGDVFYDNKVLSNIGFNNVSNEVGVLYGTYSYTWKGDVYKVIDIIDLDNFKYHIPFCHQASFVRKSLNKNFNSKYKIAGDYDYFHRLYKNSIKFEKINTAIVIYDSYGFSSKNLLLRIREQLIINNGNIYVKLYYLYFIFRHNLMRIIPGSIFRQLYKLKLIMQG